jgi:hypothetical protein
MEAILICSYTGVNAFLAGHYLANNYKWQTSWQEKTGCITVCVLTAIVGIPYVLLTFVWSAMCAIGRKIDENFQVTFFYSYYFTKKCNGLDNDKLQRINCTASKRKKKTIQDRIYHKCVSMINERNGYSTEK